MPISRYKNFGRIKDPKTGLMRLKTFPPVSAEEVRRQNDITVRLQGAMRIDKIAEVARDFGLGKLYDLPLNNLVLLSLEEKQLL